MSTWVASEVSQFALDVARGLGDPLQKWISARYFYDDLGSCLFEAITLLPEYGLTRADQRLIQSHAPEIAALAGPVSTIAELGSGSGKKTKALLSASTTGSAPVVYMPIDVSRAALEACQREIGTVCPVESVCCDWMEGLEEIARFRGSGPLLLLFLGSSVGNLQRHELVPFFRGIAARLRPGDSFLLGADLVKDEDVLVAAYDDAAGVTAAFNLNLLGRINRELNADFDIRSFAHDVRWRERERRIEMHLVSGREQRVRVGALETEFFFSTGETIWTESSHKFTRDELDQYAREGGWLPLAHWIDEEWLFAECLWRLPESS